MKKYLALFVIVVISFGIISCSHEEEMLNRSTERGSINKYRISESEAIAVLEDYLMGDEKTKGGSCSRRNINSVEYVRSSNMLTKATLETAMFPDTIIYLVNFEDDRGYAILSADERVPDVIIAVADSGSVKLSDFSRPDAIVRYRDMDDTLEVDLYNTIENDYYVGTLSTEKFIGDLATDYAQRSIEDYSSKNDKTYDSDRVIDNDNDSSADTNEDSNAGTNADSIVRNGIQNNPNRFSWVTTAEVPMMLKTLWNQKPYFNDNCPVRRSWFFGNKDKAPAGCVPIAIEQILAYKEFTDSLDGTKCDWDDIKTIYPYNNRNSIGTETARKAVARITNYIADECNAIFRHSWTFCTPTSAKRFLKKIGYEDVDINTSSFDNLNKEIITGMLDADKPLLFTALSGVCNGHAWVVDGYKQQEYQNLSTGEASSSRLLLHCNWGWHGSCNGYYISNLFDTDFFGAEIPDGYYIDGGHENNIGGKYWYFKYFSYNFPK